MEAPRKRAAGLLASDAKGVQAESEFASVASWSAPELGASGPGIKPPSRVDRSDPVPACGVDWRLLLAGASPREVLGRIVRDDPLRVRARIARVVRREALLLDADRVHLRALALVARAAVRYRGDPDLGTWLDGLVERAVEQVAEQTDREADTASGIVPDSRADNGAFGQLSRPLGLDAEAMRRACREFNRLPLADRQATFELVLQARSLDDLARERAEPAAEIARRARRGLECVLAPVTARAEAQPVRVTKGEVRT